MGMKSIILAGATVLSLAAPAAALAQPYWGHGYHEGWRDRDDWRRHEWREHERWEHGGWGWGYAPRCVIEDRGYYNWYGQYIYRPVRVCR